MVKKFGIWAYRQRIKPNSLLHIDMNSLLQSITGHILKINSDDPEVIRKGRLIQLLISLFSFVGLGILFFAGLLVLLGRLPPRPVGVPVPNLVLLLPIMAISWWFARNGRMLRSAHTFALGTSIVFLTGYIINPNPSTPYFILVSIVAIAVLDTVRVSAIYATVNIVIFLILFNFFTEFQPIFAVQFLLIVLGVCITVWGTALQLNDVVYTTRRLNKDISHLLNQSEINFEQTKSLLEFTNNLTTTHDPGEIFRRITTAYAERLKASYVALYSWEQDSEALLLQTTSQTQTQEDLGTKANSVITLSAPPADTVKKHVGQKNLSQAENTRLQQLGQHWLLEIPFLIGQESLGVAHLYRQKEQQPFSENEVQLGQAIANQSAIILRNATLTSNTRGQLAQFRSLLRLSSILAQASTLSEIYRGCRREIFSLIEAYGMSIMLLSEDGTTLQWSYAYEFGQEVDVSNVNPMPLSTGFSGHVASTQKLLSVPVTDETAEKYNTFTVGNEQGGYWTGLPLMVSTKLRGVIALESELPIQEKEVELLQTIVGPLSIAINNILQLRAIEETLTVQYRQRLQLQTAAEVAASATQIQSLDDLLQTTVDLIKDRFDLYYVGLFLTNPRTSYAVLHAGTGKAGELQIANNHQLEVGGRSLIGGATKDGEPRIIQDVLLNEEWRKNSYLPLTRSESAIPLRLPNEIIGALTVQSEVPNIFEADLVHTFQLLVDQLAIAIDNLKRLDLSQKQAKEQRWLNEVSSQLHQSTQVDKIIKIGLQSLSERLDGSPVQIKLGMQKRSQEE